jgi:FMN phosphatase YigB (HAD superfamily)
MFAMIKVLMFDLWDTLVQGDAVSPRARAALEVFSKFENEAGDKLELCLVSDEETPTPSRKPGLAHDDLIKLLDKLDLKKFFAPVERRVIFLTRAGSVEAERRAFEEAFGRVGLPARLDEYLFISGNAKRLSACRKMGMKALRFDPANSRDADFDDWAEAPQLAAPLVAPGSSFNRKLALQFYLSVVYELDLVSINYATAAGTIECRVKKSFPVTIKTGDGALAKIHTQLPVKAVVKVDKKGKVSSVESEEPNAEELAESAHFIKTLEDNKQISRGGGKPKGNETHVLETDEKGQKHLKRKRYTAI